MDFRKLLPKNSTIDIESCLPYGLIIVTIEGMVSWVNEQFLKDMEVQRDIVITSHIDIFFEDGFESIKKSAECGTKVFIRRETTKENFEVTAREIEYGYVVDIRKNSSKQINTGINNLKPSSESINKNNLIVKIVSPFSPRHVPR